MTIDRDYFLTFVLLHEAGHIHDGTSAGAFKDGEMSQLNVDPSKAKAAERQADEFAARLLRQRANTTPATSSSIAANFVVNELTKLSWNMQAFRTLDEFGSFSVGKPSVFFDDGYTHPNMALRILRTNNLIQRSAETQLLLDAFEEARERGANPKPLYGPR
ncbi:ImmA/IrrE family metallo-endopeptidase [Variovorax sp. GT1P44]|uniref:ImmA/IrrE family metallo-endopeptidase n=1 Tax=Variovorax sp. GT1P44 TaxID=3443742 RepID=UPI003F480F15